MREIIVQVPGGPIDGILFSAEGWNITKNGRLQIFTYGPALQHILSAIFHNWDAVYFKPEVPTEGPKKEEVIPLYVLRVLNNVRYVVNQFEAGQLTLAEANLRNSYQEFLKRDNEAQKENQR